MEGLLWFSKCSLNLYYYKWFEFNLCWIVKFQIDIFHIQNVLIMFMVTYSSGNGLSPH
jgi:hypothetical protein